MLSCNCCHVLLLPIPFEIRNWNWSPLVLGEHPLPSDCVLSENPCLVNSGKLPARALWSRTTKPRLEAKITNLQVQLFEGSEMELRTQSKMLNRLLQLKEKHLQDWKKHMRSSTNAYCPNVGQNRRPLAAGEPKLHLSKERSGGSTCKWFNFKIGDKEGHIP